MAATLQMNLRPLRGRNTAERRDLRRSCSDGDGLTIEMRISTVWEGLLAAGVADCPVCPGTLRLGATAAAARCDGCGTEIS